MELTRRDFFKAAGAMSVALVVTSPTFAAFVDCPRQAAFRMKDRLTQDFQEIEKVFPAKHNLERGQKYSWRSTPLGKQWMQDLDIFMDHLTNNITGPDRTFNEIRNEASMIVRGQLRDGTKINVDIMNCSAPAFTICLVRDCLKNHRLPVVFSNNWKPFAKKHAGYLMSA